MPPIQPTRIILDTDLDTDCDDTGAMAVLHALQNQGESELLGVVCSAPEPSCAPCARAINAAYGRAAIPVAAARIPDYASSAHWRPYRDHRTAFDGGGMAYNHALAARPEAAGPVEEAVSLYRRLLAAAPDAGVTICGIGTLTALAQLLASGPDAHSPLSGRDLIRRKVAKLVSMAIGTYPQGRDEFNWKMDLPAAAAVIAGWPGLLVVSEKGSTIPSGARFVAAAPKDHPVRHAYVAFLKGEGRDRPSWDLVTALYAVRGLAAPFAESGDHRLVLDPAGGGHVWTPAGGDLPRRYVLPLLDDEAMARCVEDLMIRSLSR